MPELAGRGRGRRVAVLGDALLDCWLEGTAQRLCREAPVPVVDLDARSYACGGAANTAANLAGLGASPVLVTAVGQDRAGELLRERAAAAGVEPRVVTVPGRRTLVKSRVVADEQVAVRYDEGDCGPVPETVADELCSIMTSLLGGPLDAVVVCDYDAGVLGPRIRQWLLERRADLPLLVVDAHTPTRWAAVEPDLVTPSYAEAQRVLQAPGETDRPAWVTRNSTALRRSLRAGTVAVTLDTEGAVVLAGDETPYRTYTQPAPARRASGAGDSYVAGFVLALLSGATPQLAAEVAQLAATAATRLPGTAVCGLAALGAAADAAEQRLVATDALARQVAEHRRRGRRIVFTNGCFDVLHRGHVGYLNQAKRLGDVLVVAVNSDQSVRRLKGPDRPVNPEADRVAVLAALSCVDHVVLFDADSPTELLEVVRPDVYVKGGDYRPDLIPEAPLVHRLGGEVRVLDYLYDRSTTKIIERIRTGAAA
ncbi:MAG: D-glycero-beta-D-manno-heptose 1-phosphate adenylyltransferase [Micromonosporaceae bacterium]|nr:D-glycero-beta-D-manno-heptose 1-phosphate adenylyltransferase [Micromonosporaceae bacterium]